MTIIKTTLLLCTVSSLLSLTDTLGEDCIPGVIPCPEPNSECIGVVCQCRQGFENVSSTCLQVPCGPLESPLNGDFELGQVPDTNLIEATYSCIPGFQLEGESTRTCNVETSSWDGLPPTCKPISCPPLVQPLNGQFNVSDDRGRFQSVVTYTCLEGFILEGLENRTCTATGNWTGETPVCKPRPCSPLQNISNGFVTFSEDPPVFQTVAEYQCFDGFTLEGTSSRVCESDGEFNGEEPVCSPTGIPSSTTTNPTSTTEAATTTPLECQLQCQNGGTCLVNTNGSVCVCPVGFSGNLCDVEDFCITQPCPEVAVDCVNEVSGRVCVCPVGFKGPDCTTVDVVITCEDRSKTVYLEKSPSDDERSMCLPESGSIQTDMCYNPEEDIDYQISDVANIIGEVVGDSFCVRYTGINPESTPVCTTVTAFEEDDKDLRPWINATAELCFVLNNPPVLTGTDFISVGFTSTENMKSFDLSVRDSDEHQSHTVTVQGVNPATFEDRFSVDGLSLKVLKPDALESPTVTVSLALQVVDDGIPALTSTSTYTVRFLRDADLVCEVQPPSPILYHIPNGLPTVAEELGQINCPAVDANAGLTFQTKNAIGPVKVEQDGKVMYDPTFSGIIPSNGDFELTATATVQQPVQLSTDIGVRIIATDFRASCENLPSVEFTEKAIIGTCRSFTCTERAGVSETCEDDSDLFNVTCEAGTDLTKTNVTICVAQSLINQYGEVQVPFRITNSYGTVENVLSITVIDVNFAPEILTLPNQLQGISVPEGPLTNTVIIEVEIRDYDLLRTPNTEQLQVSLTDETNTQSNIPFSATLNADQNSVAIEVTSQLSATTALHRLTLTVTDTAGETTTALLIVSVQDVNEAPVCSPATYTASVSVQARVGDSLITVLCSDPDVSPDFNVLTYSLTGSDLFSINAQGVVSVAQPLTGLANTDTLILTVVASDGGGLTDSATLTVNVDNTFPPVCENSPYQSSLSEDTDSAVCFSVPTECLDPVQNEALNFTLLSGDGTNLFQLGTDSAASAGLQLCTKKSLKYSPGSYTINVQVSSSYGQTQVEIQITVNDVNDPPEFAQALYSADVSESVSQGYLILTLSAADPDKGVFGRITYFSQDLDNLPAFSLNADTGEINVVQALDFDVVGQSNTYTVVVGASDGSPNPYTATATLEINILDINDNGPDCHLATATANIELTDPVGTVVFRMDCEDRDISSQYNQIGYKIRDTTDVFTVNSTGHVILNTALARNQNTYTIRVEAYDEDKPTEFTFTVTLTINVNTAIAPICDPPAIQRVLRETQPVRDCLDDEVICRDPTNTEVYLTRVSGSGNEFMEIRYNNGTAQIGLNACIQKSIKDQFGQYELVAEVSNGLASTNVVWSFSVQNINEAPYFTSKVFETTVDETFQDNQEILIISAGDPDEAFAEPTFKIESVTAELVNNGDFDNQLSSTILFVEQARAFFAVRLMNATVRNLYKYNLTVQDGEGLYDTAEAMVHVRDINSPPICPVIFPTAETTILADIDTGVYTVDCYDTDVDPLNTRLQYKINNGDPDGYFNVTEDGTVVVSRKFPRTRLYNTGRANLTIAVSDTGTPSYTTTIYLNVVVDNQISPVCNPVVTPPDIWVIDKCATLTMDCTDPSFPDQTNHLSYTQSGNFSQGFTLQDSQESGVFTLCYRNTFGALYAITVRVDNGLKASLYTETIQVQYLAATPVFTSALYKEEVTETFAANTVLATVQAVSAQLVGSLVYSIDGPGSTEGWATYFSLDQNTGEISTLLELRGLADQIVRLRIEAEDTGSKLRSAAQMEITVVDINEPPTCQVTTDLDIDVTTAIGTKVVSLDCVDPDVKPKYKTLVYELSGNGAQSVFKLEPPSDPTGIVIAQALDLSTSTYALQLTLTDEGTPQLSYTQSFTVTVSLLPPPLKLDLAERTYESILIKWRYDRADFFSVTQSYVVVLSHDQGAAIESAVQGAGIRQLNVTGLHAETTYTVIVKATTQYGVQDSQVLTVTTPQVPRLKSFVYTIRILSEDYTARHRDPASQIYYDLMTRVVSTLGNLLRDTAGYAGSHVKGFRPSNSILVDAITYVNQSGNVNDTRMALESRINTGWFGDLSVDSGYFISAVGNGYVLVESIQVAPNLVANGSDATITCNVLTVGYNLSAEFVYWWTYNGRMLEPTSGSRFRTSNTTSQVIPENKQSILTISPILNENAGLYGCIASDQSLTQVASRDVSVSVLSQPVVTLTPRSQTVNEGQAVVLICELATDDTTFTQFVWYKDGALLQSGTGIQVVQGEGNEILTIQSAEATAVYACEGQGPAGTGQRVTANIGVIPTGPSSNVFCERTTEVRSGYTVQWPTTAVNSVAVEGCPPNFRGEISRKCDALGVWELSVYNCVTGTMQDIGDTVTAIRDGTSTSNLSVAIGELATETNRPLLEGDLTVAIDTINNIATIVNDPTESANLTEEEVVEDTINYLKVASNLIDEQTQPAWVARLSQNLDGGISVPVAVEGYIKGRLNKMGTSNGDYFRTYSEKNIYAEVGRGTRDSFEFPDRSQSSTPDWLKQTETNIKIPKQALQDYAPNGYGSSFYRNLPNILATRFIVDGQVSSAPRHINADTVTFQVLGDVGTIDPPAVITFQHYQTNYSDPKCSSWDTSRKAYVTDGCELITSTDQKTECSCNHFTNFAILMSPGKTPAADVKALSIISAVGCAISIFCLVLTIVLYLIVWRLVKCDRSVLLLNLCIALIVSYIVFLAGVGQAENEDLCTAVSVLLHFFYLAVFFLMLAYGIEIGVTIIYVFATSSRIKWLLPLAWGIPLVIVAISAGVTQLDGYGNESFCWLSIEDGLLWAFVGPAAFVILFNFIIVVAVFRQMFKSAAMLTKTDKEKAKTGVRSLCILLPILGLTWVFGVFSVNEDLVVFQYIFAVCNSLQGLFIFLFHCVFNQQLRDAFKQRRARKKSLQSFDKSFKPSSTSSTGFYSDNNKPNNDSGFTTESSNPFLQADRQMKELVEKNKKGSNLYDNALKSKVDKDKAAVDLEDVKISNILRESEVMGGTTGISSILQTQSTSLPDTTRVTDDEKQKGVVRASVVSSHKYDYIDAPASSNKPKFDNTVYVKAESQIPNEQPYKQTGYSTSLDYLTPSKDKGRVTSQENLTDKQKGKIYGGNEKKGSGERRGFINEAFDSGDRKKGTSKGSQLSKASSRSDDDPETATSAQNVTSISTALPTISYDEYQAKARKGDKKGESSLKKKDKQPKKKPVKDRSKAYEYSFESTYMGEPSRHASLESMNMQQYNSPYAQMPGMGGYGTGRPTHQQQHWDQYRDPYRDRGYHQQQQQRQPYYRGDYW